MRRKAVYPMLAQMTAVPPMVAEPVVRPTNKSQAALLMDLMQEALRVDDAKLNSIATELLCNFGDLPVRSLLREVFDRRHAPAHHVRVLRVLQRLMPFSDVDAFFDLTPLLRDRDEGVREVASELLGPLVPRLDAQSAANVAAAGLPNPADDGIDDEARLLLFGPSKP